MRIAAHGWELRLLPGLGGAIGSLRLEGRDVLRPTPDGADDPFQTASFPLLPYANRIAHGLFPHGGRQWQLPLNFGDHPHSLHGIAWQRAWEVGQVAEAEAVLRFRHPGGQGWPWPFSAEQRFRLLADGFQQSLVLTNLADETVPAGLGFHPYFPRHADSRLKAIVDAAWEADETCLPLGRAAADRFGDWAAGDSLTRPEMVDNAHEGWAGEALISGGGQAFRLTADGAPHLHLYIPPDSDFFCAEPVTHLPDAPNRGGLTELAPGARMEISMRITPA